ncbi:MAG: phosphatidylglycerophosphatase A [Opitutales bacterium]
MNGDFGRTVLGALPDSWVLGMACAGRLGHQGRTPGTLGALVGLVVYLVLFFPLTLPGQVLLGIVLAFVAMVVCGEAERRLHKRDPDEVILDQIVAQPLVFLGLPAGLIGTWWGGAALLLGFGLFRLFDWWQPFGIRRLRRLPDGQGMVGTALAAALAACLVLHAALYGAQAAGWLVLARGG